MRGKGGRLLAILVVFLIPCFLFRKAEAQSFTYVPLDDRPYSLDRVLEAAEALGVRLALPPDSFFQGRDGIPDFAGLYEWLSSHRGEGPTLVAADAFLFGGLVSSRTHTLDESEIGERFEALRNVCSAFPKPPAAIFGTLLRLPRQSQGTLDADYNAKWAPQLFRLARLQSAASRGALAGDDLAAAERLLRTIPAPVLQEWANRRNRSLRAAKRLLSLHGSRGIDFVGIGLDDNVSPLWLEDEFRVLSATIGDAPASQAALVPGVDQMGFLLFGRLFLEDKPRQRVYPFFSVVPDASGKPHYSGFSPADSLRIQADVLGVEIVGSPENADLVLALNLPAGGRTLEASSQANRQVAGASERFLAEGMASFIEGGKRVALADIAFDNGADNGLMALLGRRKLLGRLAGYSGGNTSDNAIGMALATGVLSAWMSETGKRWILFTRLLDEWGYQSNVRPALVSKGPFGGQAGPERLEEEILEKLDAFSRTELPDFAAPGFEVSYPWGRLFEIRLTKSTNGAY